MEESYCVESKGSIKQKFSHGPAYYSTARISKGFNGQFFLCLLGKIFYRVLIGYLRKMFLSRKGKHKNSCDIIWV